MARSKHTNARGQRRRKRDRPERQPGDQKTDSFENFAEEEGECAAYCGYDNIADFRAFAISPYVLKYYNQFHSLKGKARRAKALALLRDIKDEKAWSGDEEPSARYPLTQEQKGTDTNSHHQLAMIAYQLVHNLRKGLFSASDWDAHATEFKRLTTYDIPRTVPLDEVVIPDLGPFEKETRIEPYNRAMNIVAYLMNSAAATKWSSRFGSAKWHENASVREDQVPPWMRPSDGKTNIEDLADVPLHSDDKREPKLVKAVWLYDYDDEECAEYLAYFKENHKSETFSGKPKKREAEVLIDPRMNAEMVRDAIRAAFRMPEFEAQMSNIVLVADDGLPTEDSKDAMEGPWEDIEEMIWGETPRKALFKFCVRQRLPEENALEYEGPPLCLSSVLKVKDGEVLTTTEVPEETLEDRKGKVAGVASGGTRTPFDPLAYFENDKQRMTKFYDGYDVSTPAGKLAWQKKFFNQIAGFQSMPREDKKVSKFHEANIKLDPEQAAAIDAAGEEGTATALNMDTSELSGGDLDAQFRYYTFQASGSGTQAQVGPPLDISAAALELSPDHDKKGREVYKFDRFKEDQVKRTLYPWQANGTAFVLPRLLGYLPTRPDASAATKKAAESLKALKTGAAFINDETGTGKSVFLLSILKYAQDHVELGSDGQREFRMKFLAVPQTLLRQWANEILDNWPVFDLMISYDDGSLPERLNKHVVSSTAVKQYPAKEHWPKAYDYVFDKHNPRTGTTIWLTTYETHVERTLTWEAKSTSGESKDGDQKPKTDTKATEAHSGPVKTDGDSKTKTKKKKKKGSRARKRDSTPKSNMQDVFDVVAGDEGHKWKRPGTARWWSAKLLRARCFVFMSATPTINTEYDLMGPLMLVWDCVERTLQADPDAEKWVQSKIGSLSTFEDVDELAMHDTRRLSLLNPTTFKNLLETEDLVAISHGTPKMENLVSIRRSKASRIPRDEAGNDYFEMRQGMKPHFIRTRSCKRRPDEELEFQFLHREVIRRFLEASKRKSKDGSKGLFTPATGAKDKFVYGTGEMREACIITGSTTAAVFNLILTQLAESTLVDALDRLREKSFNAFDLVRMVCRATDRQLPKTASGYLEFLCHGSPILRAILKQIQEKFLTGSNGKLIIAEEIPYLAWYYNLVLDIALWNTEVFHAGLSGSERDDLVLNFNTPGKGPKGIIMQFDVGSLGLNMDGDCHHIIICISAKNHGTEVQMYGRVIRNTQDEIVYITKLFVENSICGYRESKKADKYIVELATRAQDPALRRLMVELLNEYQEEVRAAQDAAEKAPASEAPQDLANDEAEDAEDSLSQPEDFEPAESKRQPKKRTFYADDMWNYEGQRISPEDAEMHEGSADEDIVEPENAEDAESLESDDDETIGGDDDTDGSGSIYSDEGENQVEDDDDSEFEDSDETATEPDADFTPGDDEYEEDEEEEEEDGGDLLPEKAASKQSIKRAQRRAARKAMESENQMEESERQRARLLALPYDKVYTDHDLNDPEILRRGLQLVHCRRLGINPDTVPSPHIKYTHLSHELTESLEQAHVLKKSRKPLLNHLLGGGKEADWKGEKPVPKPPVKTTKAVESKEPEVTNTHQKDDVQMPDAAPAPTAEPVKQPEVHVPASSPEAPSSTRQRSPSPSEHDTEAAAPDPKTYRIHNIKKLKQLCEERGIDWKAFKYKFKKQTYVDALIEDDRDYGRRTRKKQKVGADDVQSTSEDIIQSSKALFERREMPTTPVKLLNYESWTDEKLKANMEDRNMDVSDQRGRNIKRLKFYDASIILSQLPFDLWPDEYITEMVAVWGLEAGTREDLVNAMNDFESSFVYPPDWPTDTFLYTHKAPCDYLAGLCEISVEIGDLGHVFEDEPREVLLEHLRVRDKKIRKDDSIFSHPLEQIYGISQNGDLEPYRKLHPQDEEV